MLWNHSPRVPIQNHACHVDVDSGVTRDQTVDSSCIFPSWSYRRITCLDQAPQSRNGIDVAKVQSRAKPRYERHWTLGRCFNLIVRVMLSLWRQSRVKIASCRQAAADNDFSRTSVIGLGTSAWARSQRIPVGRRPDRMDRRAAGGSTRNFPFSSRNHHDY